jgi:hypothetical protein
MTHPSQLYLGKLRFASFLHGSSITKKHIFFLEWSSVFFLGGTKDGELIFTELVF